MPLLARMTECWLLRQAHDFGHIAGGAAEEVRSAAAIAGAFFEAATAFVLINELIQLRFAIRYTRCESSNVSNQFWAASPE